MSSFLALRSEKTADGQQLAVQTQALEQLPAGDVLVEVHWSSLNYKDALSATGRPGVTRQYPHTPGIDAAGVVLEAAEGPFQPGDQVIVTGYDLGMNTAGGYGQRIRVPGDWLVRLPQNFTLRDSMVWGTAGLTAALCVQALLDAGLSPEAGEVLVTGASGGVGSVAVALLSRLGFTVIAASGKNDARDWLLTLGAQRVISREEILTPPEKPLVAPRWAGAVDTVGGDILAGVLKSVRYGGSVACCGLARSAVLETTVLPFILRGINLLGVDSVELPITEKQRMWEVIASDWLIALGPLLTAEVSLAELTPWFEQILAGQVRGRVLVKVS